MRYKNEFNVLVDKCIKEAQYVGLGYPNAKILIVGKEAGIDVENDTESLNLFKQNAKDWKSGIDYSKPYLPDEDSKLRDYKHTWQKYQILHDKIFNHERPEKYYITFVKNIFTTELSNLPARNTLKAKQNNNFIENLKNRKKIFWESDFIKQFPIIIIPALDEKYITNYGNGKTREIDNIFKVEFCREVQCSNRDKYWVHYSIIKHIPKILIHTRQLTNGASNKLIEEVAEEIRKFVLEYSIDLGVDFKK